MSSSRIAILVTAAIFSLSGLPIAGADITTLRSQLESASEHHDDLAQIEILRRILDAEPGDKTSHRRLIELWLKIRDYDMAETTLQAWPDAPPQLSALTRAEVKRFRDEDNPGAIRELEEYLHAAPRDIPALEALVACLLSTPDHHATLDAFDRLVPLRRTGENLIRRAGEKLSLGDYRGAVADAKAAQKYDAASPIVKDNLPRFERLEESLQALPTLDRRLAANPKDFNALLDRSWWRRYGGMLDGALADAMAAAALEPDSIMAKIACARARYMLDQVKPDDVRRDSLIEVTKLHSLEAAQAIAACDLALAANPKDASQLTRRAQSLIEAEQFALARRDVDSALSTDPKATEAGIAGLEAAVFMGDDAGAATFLRQIEAMQPEKQPLAKALSAAANIYLEKSNLSLAVQFADKSLALQETESALRVKAAALQRQGHTAEAKSAFDRADALKKKKKP